MKRPTRGIRIAQAVLLVGAAFFVVGVALSPTQSPSPSVVEENTLVAEEREEPAKEEPDAETLVQEFVRAVEEGDDGAFNEALDLDAASRNAYDWVLSQTSVEYVGKDTRADLEEALEDSLTPQGFSGIISSEASTSVEQTSSSHAFAELESEDSTVTLELAVLGGSWHVVGIDAWGMLFDGTFVSEWVVVLEEGEAQHIAEIEAEKEAEAAREAEEAAREAEEAAREAEEAEREAEIAAQTMGQRQAVATGYDYLDYTAFSRQGLIGQLEYEGFSTADATYAVDFISPDWNLQAAVMAQDYLDYTSFSRQGLIDQLVYEGFTRAQAEYGVDAVGY